jgi:hypothetical protein
VHHLVDLRVRRDGLGGQCCRVVEALHRPLLFLEAVKRVVNAVTMRKPIPER